MSLIPTFWLLTSLAAAPAPQAPPRDRPAPARAEAQLERTLRDEIATGRAPETTYTQLAKVLRERGDVDAADAVDLQWRDKFPTSVQAQTAAAGVFNRRGEFEKTIEALRAIADLQPQSPEARHRIAVFFWDKSRADDKLDAETKRSYIMQGIEAENQALALNPEYVEALTYKNILLRLQANLTADPAEQARLIAEADELRNRVISMQRQRESQPSSTPRVEEPVFTGFDEPFDQAVVRLSPVRVGGNVRTPAKTRDVKPRYPPDAMRKRVQGVVIMQALIDESGAVVNAQILQSEPMLAAAAMDAVRQWRFTPTELDGRRVPILMTVTVNFTLQAPNQDPIMDESSPLVRRAGNGPSPPAR